MKKSILIATLFVAGVLSVNTVQAQNTSTQDSKNKEKAKEGVHDVGHGAKEVGKGTKDVAESGGKAAGKGVKKGGKAVGNTAEKGAKKVKGAVN